MIIHPIIYKIAGGQMPSTGSSLFTGATIPLTYKNNTNEKETKLEYKSTYDIYITGLDGRATITGNGTKSVLVEFDVSSSVSSLKNFTIELKNGAKTVASYKGLHAHYGEEVTGILTFAYTNIPPDSGVGTIGVEYKFIETTTPPYFSATTTLWNTIYSYQVLAVLIGNFNGSIGDDFLSYCYSFNQPLDISGITIIGHYFLSRCYSFNQPLTIPSGVTSIGTDFLRSCSSFNQPLDISNVTSIGSSLLYSCDSLSTIIWNAEVVPTDNNALSQSINSKTSTDGAGIKVYGSERATLLQALPNRTSRPYRKLVDGGY